MISPYSRFSIVTDLSTHLEFCENLGTYRTWLHARPLSLCIRLCRIEGFGSETTDVGNKLIYGLVIQAMRWTCDPGCLYPQTKCEIIDDGRYAENMACLFYLPIYS